MRAALKFNGPVEWFDLVCSKLLQLSSQHRLESVKGFCDEFQGRLFYCNDREEAQPKMRVVKGNNEKSPFSGAFGYLCARSISFFLSSWRFTLPMLS